MAEHYAETAVWASKTGASRAGKRVAKTLPGQMSRKAWQVFDPAGVDFLPNPPQGGAMSQRSPRLAARALILQEDRLLLVNAYPGGRSDLWCAPGGGVERGSSLPDNLAREVLEECGLTIAVGAPALINEFHDPKSGFHQVDLFFRCTVLKGNLSADWRDPEGVVTERRFFSRAEMESGKVRFKPDSLAQAAWGTGCHYDPLEPIVS